MTDKIRELADKAKESVPKGILSVEQWIDQYNVLFANLIVQECIDCCGSQADKKNIRYRFDLPIESDILYPAPEKDGSINSQYQRKYNLPKEVKQHGS